MRVKIRLRRSEHDLHPVHLYEGGFSRPKQPMPHGFVEFATPQLDLPSGIGITVRAVYDREGDIGELWVESAGAVLVHVASMRVPLNLRVRLTSDEVVWVSAALKSAR